MKRFSKLVGLVLLVLVLTVVLVSCADTKANPITSPETNLEVSEIEATTSEVETKEDEMDTETEEVKESEEVDEAKEVETSEEVNEVEETKGETEEVKPEVTETSTPTTHVHDYVSQVVKDATCGEDGLMAHICSTCEEMYTTVIPANGNHNYTSSVVKNPTCLEEGSRAYVCSVCGTMYTEVIPTNGNHAWETVHIPGSGHYDTGGTHKVMFKKCDCGFTLSGDTPNADGVWREHGLYCSKGYIYWYEDVPNHEPVYVVDYPDRDVTYCPLCGAEK